MPKYQTDKLVRLIDRMSKAEKRSFTLYVKRNRPEGETKFLQLFQFLVKEKSADESAILKKIPSIKKVQLSNIKANLFKQILSCLRLIERSKVVEIQIREQIDFARILYNKGMYKACIELLDKAKKQSIEFNFETLTLSILYFEKRIESQHVTGSMFAKADELSDASDKVLKEISLTNQLSNASLLLYGRYLKHGYVKSQEEFIELKSYVDSLLPAYNIRDLQFYQKLYLYQTYVWFYNMSQDFPNYYKYSKKWIELYNDSPHLKITITTPFIKGYHNVLNALFMAEKRDRFNIEYRMLLRFDIYQKPNPTQNEVALYYLFRWIHFLNKIFLNAEYKVTSDLIYLEQLLESNEYGWDLNRQLSFYYKIGCVYFGIGDLDKTREYLNKITNNYYPRFREDIQSFARILNLIANYDLGNEELVIYQIKSLYRFLSKMKELGEVQMEIINFLRKTPQIAPNEVIDSFIKLKDKLTQIEKKPFEKRPFLYLDIISWLEAKIHNTTIKEVIQNKLTSS